MEEQKRETQTARTEPIGVQEYWSSFLNTINEPETERVKTGFFFLDNTTKGLRPQNLYVLGGRPGVGKTSLAISLGVNIAKQYQKDPTACVVFFSLEMTTQQVHENAFANFGNVKKEDFWLSKKDFYEKHKELIDNPPALNLFVFDKSDVKTSVMSYTLNQLKQAGWNVKAVIVDHLQILAQNYEGVAYERTTRASRDLKILAKSLNVPVVALAQLSREVERNTAKASARSRFIEPTNADLRDSGSIEQDADFIALLFSNPEHKNEYYDIITAKVSKHREWKIGKYFLEFEKSFSRLKNTTIKPEF